MSRTIPVPFCPHALKYLPSSGNVRPWRTRVALRRFTSKTPPRPFTTLSASGVMPDSTVDESPHARRASATRGCSDVVTLTSRGGRVARSLCSSRSKLAGDAQLILSIRCLCRCGPCIAKRRMQTAATADPDGRKPNECKRRFMGATRRSRRRCIVSRVLESIAAHLWLIHSPSRGQSETANEIGRIALNHRHDGCPSGADADRTCLSGARRWPPVSGSPPDPP
jgi:hypothetical protein